MPENSKHTPNRSASCRSIDYQSQNQTAARRRKRKQFLRDFMFKSISSMKYAVPATLAAACLVALAKTWGPFMASAAGPEFAGQTFATDKGNEWNAANKITATLVSPVIAARGAIAIAKAIKDDYVRIVYMDGIIADFKITSRFGGTEPVDFVATVADIKYKRKPASLLRAEKHCGSYSITYETGHWGEEQETRPNPDGGLPIVAVIARWISTGSVTERSDRNDCK